MKNTKLSKFGYLAGNILHSLSILLFLPAAYQIDPERGVLVSIGFVSGQIASVIGNYSFAIIGPRLILSNWDARIMIFNTLFGYKLVVLAVAQAVAILSSCWLDINGPILMLSICISYSMVLFVQWYHMMCTASYIPQVLLVASRSIVATLCLLVTAGNSTQSFSLTQFLTACCVIMFIPILISLWVFGNGLGKKKEYKRDISGNFVNIFRNGAYSFTASLATTIYQIGPSLMAGVIDINSLLYVQQFDRVRMILGNFSGVVYSVIYPYVISNNKKGIITIGALKVILLTFLVLNVFVILIFGIAEDRNYIDQLLSSLSLTYEIVQFAIMCALTATFSALLANLHFFPNSDDKTYFQAIASGALSFIILAFGYIIFSRIIPSASLTWIASIVLSAELVIFSCLLIQSYRNIKPNKCAS